MDPLTCSRVATLAGAAVGHAELAEAREGDLAAASERALDRLQKRVDSLRCVSLAQSGPVRNLVNKLGFRHLLLLRRGLGLLEANTASGRTCKGYRGAITAFCEDLRVTEGLIPTGTDARAVGTAARIGAVNLARIVWLAVVLVCLVTVLILLLQGYYGYAGVTFAVAVAAGTNLT